MSAPNMFQYALLPIAFAKKNTWRWNISCSGKGNFHSQIQILCHLWATWFMFIVTPSTLHQIYCSHFPFMF